MAGGRADRSRSAGGRGGGASRGGWAPLRADAPGRLPRSVGSYPDLSTEAARDAALAAADSDIYAASSGPPVASRIRFIHRALAEWGWTAWPPSYEKIRALGAVLKAGGYRSAAHYLSQYKVSGERRGYHFDGPLLRALADYKRSCERGMGPPVPAKALPCERLHELAGEFKPWVSGGPVCPATCWSSAPGL